MGRVKQKVVSLLCWVKDNKVDNIDDAFSANTQWFDLKIGPYQQSKKYQWNGSSEIRVKCYTNKSFVFFFNTLTKSECVT